MHFRVGPDFFSKFIKKKRSSSISSTHYCIDMASLTTENALRQQVNALGQSLGFADMSTKSFTAADLRLLLIDSLQKLDALSPSSANDEGETKTSNGLNSGGPQPQTKEELRTWLEEYCKDMKNHGEPNTWDVTLVMDMSKLFQKMKTFNEPKISVEYFNGNKYEFHVRKSEIIQPAFEQVGHIKRSGYEFHVQKSEIIQPAFERMGHIKRS